MKFQESFARDNLKYFPALNVFLSYDSKLQRSIFFRHTLVDLIITIGATKISFIGQGKKTVNLHVRSSEKKNMVK